MAFFFAALIVVMVILSVVIAGRLGGGSGALPVLGWSLIAILAVLGMLGGFFAGIWGLVPGVPALLLFAAMALLTLRRWADKTWLLPCAWIPVVPAVSVPRA